MNNYFKILMIVIFCVAGAASARAVTSEKTFTISASVPAALGVNFIASSVDNANNFTLVTGTNLTFDPMTLNIANGVYLPNHFFAIDVGAASGAGIPSVTATYTEGLNPNNPGKGLGYKSTATFVRVQGSGTTQTEVPLTSHGPKKLLINVSGEQITAAEIVGGFLRIYLGIVPGGTGTPTGGEPFTNGDKPGSYDGKLLLSGTIL